MSNFDRALQLVLADEGVFSNDPQDNGGATKYGVTIGTLGDWRRKPVSVEDVRALSQDEAKEIYKAMYWDRVSGDQLPWAIALLVFDAAVNSHPVTAIKWLQTALGVVADGHLGPVTLSSAAKASTSGVVSRMVAERLLLMARHEDFKTYGRGWFRRVTLRVIQAVSSN